MEYSFGRGIGARSVAGGDSEEWLVSAISSLCARRWLFLAGVALARVPATPQMRDSELPLFHPVARNFCRLVCWTVGASVLPDVESVGQVDS